MDMEKVKNYGAFVAAVLATVATPFAAISGESAYATGGEVTTIDLGKLYHMLSRVVYIKHNMFFVFVWDYHFSSDLRMAMAIASARLDAPSLS